jgi:hypothetical protein
MSGALSLVDWNQFATTAERTRVVSIDHRPRCLHQDGTLTLRDACFYKTSGTETAHIEAFEAGFNRLSPARQRRLVAHETFRALGMDPSDESYELSNAIYVAMPDAPGTGRSQAPAISTIEPLVLSGTYQTASQPCGIKLYRSQAGHDRTVLNATFVQIGGGVGNFCPAQGVSVVAHCGPVSCLLEFTLSYPVETCAQKDANGECYARAVTYEGKHYAYALTPLDDGTLNVLGTMTSANGRPDEIVKNQLFRLVGMKP